MRRRFAVLCLAAVVAGLIAWFLWRRFTPPSFDGHVLRWGGDASGGAPYIIERGPDWPPLGFEGELAEYLAGQLDVAAQFVQKDWDMLPSDLGRGDIDVVLNGYEWSPDRERKM